MEEVETTLPEGPLETSEPVAEEVNLTESGLVEMEIEQPVGIPEEIPSAEVPEEQVEISETILTISDKVEEEEIPAVEEAVSLIEPGTSVEVVSEETLSEIPELEITEPVLPVDEETEPVESILTDESAAAAAAAIGIPLFAENASKPGVTESLPPLTASQIPVEEETQIPAEQTMEEPLSVVNVEEELSQVEVPETTEAMVSDALESIMLPEEPALTVTKEEAVEMVSEEVVPPTEEFIPEVAEEVVNPIEEPVSEIEEVVAAEPIAELEPEPVVEEDVLVPTEEIAAVAMVEEPVLKAEEAAVALPEPDYDILFTNAQRMVEAGDYSTAQPALSNLIISEQKLDDIIALVQEALKRDPTDFDLWLTLGDANGRSGKLQNALDAYTKAEEYLQ